MVTAQHQQPATMRNSMSLRARGGVSDRGHRTARRRGFNLELSFARHGSHAPPGKQIQLPASPAAQLAPLPSSAGCTLQTSEQQMPPAAPCGAAEPSATSLLLSIASVSIPACEGGRRHSKRHVHRLAGSGRTTQLRSFTLHALIPARAPPPASPTPAHAAEQPSQQQEPTDTKLSAFAFSSHPATPAGSYAHAKSLLPAQTAELTGTAPMCVISSPLRSTGATPPMHATPGLGIVLGLGATPGPGTTPRLGDMTAAQDSSPRTASLPRPNSSMQWLCASPLEGVPERTSLGSAMQPHASMPAPTTCIKAGHMATYSWLTPIEGLLETRILARSGARQLTLQPSAQSSPALTRQPSTASVQPSPFPASARPSPTAAATPMEGVPERAYLPHHMLPAAARTQALLSSQVGAGAGGSEWSRIVGGGTIRLAHAGSGGSSSVALHLGTPMMLQLDSPATAQLSSPSLPHLPSPAAAQLGSPLSQLDSPAGSAGAGSLGPSTGTTQPAPARVLCEAQVQTTVGLAERYRPAQAARSSFSPVAGLLLPQSLGGNGDAGMGDHEDIGELGLSSINSTPCAMQPLGAISAPPSALPSPAAAQPGSISLDGGEQRLPADGVAGLQARTPAAQPAHQMAGLWPASAARSRLGPGTYGDDDAGELADGGHMAPPDLPAPAENGGEDWSEGGVASGDMDDEDEEEEHGQKENLEHCGHQAQDSNLGSLGSKSLSNSSRQGPSAGKGQSQGAQQEEGASLQGQQQQEGREQGQPRPTKRAQRGNARAVVAPAPATSGSSHKSRRKSLAGAGLLLDDDGKRRSSRNRIRPLQYWRNEHKVYGRDHRTLPTVVAVETRTPNTAWPANSTGHEAKKKMRARTRAAHRTSPVQGARPPRETGQGLEDWEDDA